MPERRRHRSPEDRDTLADFDTFVFGGQMVPATGYQSGLEAELTTLELRERAMDKADRDGAFADGRRDALHVA